MAESYTPRIVAANRLDDGVTVYLDRNRQWVRDHRAAAVATTAGVADMLLGSAESAANRIVEPRLIEVSLDRSGTPYPRDFREQARITGPTVGPVRLQV